MKTIVKILLIAVMVTSIVGCSSLKKQEVDHKVKVTEESTANDVTSGDDLGKIDKDTVADDLDDTMVIGGDNSVEIPNPFIECDSLEEALDYVNFEVKIPTQIPEGYKLANISVIENELLELIYTSENSEIVYRQGVGFDDISGDYNMYNDVEEVINENLVIRLSGNNTLVNLATWNDELSSYSVNINIGEQGLDSELVLSFIESIR